MSFLATCIVIVCISFLNSILIMIQHQVGQDPALMWWMNMNFVFIMTQIAFVLEDFHSLHSFFLRMD